MKTVELKGIDLRGNIQINYNSTCVLKFFPFLFYRFTKTHKFISAN